ncbi:nicotinate (nicotinamide) nucleotide adenylyltransferase [Balneolaceae bacterium YR4-1]|uniref:Probable nicotinate-nucleotide adenylyltransferase n=1 Tax=Halalkalibaculum roseum TaxID=2709311 RepID=A0A6M1SUB0_9BACT|nr:nicotinate (nicotinamide) nucleotide adenylyltransferase [Halalkalibaculum roseum]NGP76422.1 nicotinate (nicotinamide) nucleotide adenylyltransferase [Halalkalibaculum roseum]
MSSDKRGIGLLGGTFDPVHNGHIAICRSYLDSGYIDKLYVVLTPNPPHKTDRELTDFNHRLNMLNLALNDLSNLWVSAIEDKLSRPSYTVNTVMYFRNEFPDEQLYLCIGEDSFNHFTEWYHWEEIIENCTLLVARRPNTDDSNLPEKLKNNARFIGHEEIGISSSEIRDRLSDGEDVAQELPEEVMNYINDHHLYQTAT